jgi:serine/threonine protein phosphatase PrpC
MKIYGVFDGHGIYGHLVSSFVAGTMLNYVRNHDRTFTQKKLEQASDEHINRILKKCFKHCQR